MGLRDFLTERKRKKFKKKYKVGLCLSGGGTRGFCYIGVFKALEELGIQFDAIAGASAGSLFGSLYASGMKSSEMIDKVKNMKDTDFRKAKLGFLPSKMDNLMLNLKAVLPVKKIEDMVIPFYVVAVDLKTGEEKEFSQGDVCPIVAGSCAIPGAYYPVKYKNMNLIDGGVTNNIPVDVLKRNGCDYVVTIDCNSTRGGGTTSENIITQFTTSVGIMMVNNSSKGLRLSDLVIRPDLQKFNSMKVAGKEEMIQIGYTATMQAKEQLEKLFLGEYKRK